MDKHGDFPVRYVAVYQRVQPKITELWLIDTWNPQDVDAEGDSTIAHGAQSQARRVGFQMAC